MSRKAHKKSRRGCLQCKGRHIKCDESRPSCLHCLSSERECSFSSSNSSSGPPAAREQRILNHRVENVPSPAITESSYPNSIQTTSSPEDSLVNMVHMTLFHDVQTMMKTGSCFGADPNVCEQGFEAVIGYAMTTPYLMHLVLAMAASYRASLVSEQRDFFEHQATELQTHALFLFNSRADRSSDEDYAQRFLFSGFLGIHVLHETLKFRHDDFGQVLEKVVQYLRLTQGVRLEIGGSWEQLCATGLKPFLEDGARLHGAEGAHVQELEYLESLIKNSTLDPATILIYEDALKHLKMVFYVSSHNVDPSSQGSTNLISAFPILVTPSYTDMVTQRRPEALIILAHYAALLYQHRDIWIIGDGGGRIVESIARYLGTYWETWLAWPIKVIHT